MYTRSIIKSLARKIYEAELVTLRGAIFGKLIISPVCISFKSEERKEDEKYKYGSPDFHQIKREVNKKWKLETIKEIVVKRYNLIRQAVEIYFDNSRSAFFSLYSHQHLRKFLLHTKAILKKRQDLEIALIYNPEKFFAEKKFKEEWANSKISNFEYLMLLNKYGGRSFNDLNQYPVFPWIISNYDSNNFEFEEEKNYRDLNITIGGISEKKKELADNKLDMTSQIGEIEAYQIGVHYLPGRVVLGFFIRLEPFASLMLQFEKGHDSASRMFHIIKRIWLSGKADPNDNKELVPEFYYLPEMFVNSNKYSYGIKLPDEDLIEYVNDNKLKVRVDNVVLPKWAANQHYFVKYNAIALESTHASMNLNNWIDMIFGCSQQDSRLYNKYKAFCDEEFITKNFDKMTQSQFAEIQEFGTNPIKLFSEAHPVKDEASMQNKMQYSIFNPEKKDALFGVIKLNEFPLESVSYIKSTENRVFVVLSNQRLFRTQEEYVNSPHEKPFVFEKKETRLFPYKKLSRKEESTHITDTQRSFAVLEKGKYFLSCRHYDNSCKIISNATGEPFLNLFFHLV